MRRAIWAHGSILLSRAAAQINATEPSRKQLEMPIWTRCIPARRSSRFAIGLGLLILGLAPRIGRADFFYHPDKPSDSQSAQNTFEIGRVDKLSSNQETVGVGLLAHAKVEGSVSVGVQSSRSLDASSIAPSSTIKVAASSNKVPIKGVRKDRAVKGPDLEEPELVPTSELPEPASLISVALGLVIIGAAGPLRRLARPASLRVGSARQI
jgi:hypothetical protein